MKWTKQVPTVDGWYFVRRKYPQDRAYSVQPVYILRLDDGEMYYKDWYNCIEDYGSNIEIEGKAINFSWFAGPLPEPEEE